ncbi:hypothetical protein AC1031_014404 [Aphanomyces cochlioides]|nr:hypothetical protein AC1031_014404 [Aphanomyces cochlioides]
MQSLFPSNEDFDDDNAVEIPPSQRKTMASHGRARETIQARHGMHLPTSYRSPLVPCCRKDGRAIRKRFELMLANFKKGEMESMRKSGTTEEYSERLRLITGIASRMEDYEQNLDVRAELEEKKREGLVSSGDVVRKLALNNIAKHGNDESADEDSDVENFEESKQKAPKKRKNKAEGRRHSKRQTRRDTLETLVSTITAGLNTTKQNDEEIAKIQRERLEFDREEARKNLERHTAFMKLLQDITAGRNQAKP